MALQVLPKESMEYRSLSRQLVSSISGRNVLDESGQENGVSDQAQNDSIQHPVQQRRFSGTRQQPDERRHLHSYNTLTNDERDIHNGSRHSNPQRSFRKVTQAPITGQHTNILHDEGNEVQQRRGTRWDEERERRNAIYPHQNDV